jgi:hypothetical protein
VTDPVRPAREAEPPRYDPATELVPPEPADPGTAPAAPAATAPQATTAPQPTAAPLASVIAKPKSSSGRGTSILLAVAAAIAIGGLAFAAGRLTAPAATASAGRPGNGQLPVDGQYPGTRQVPGNGQLPGRGDAMGGITLNGTVTAISTDSITLQLASGTSITIPLDSDTAYRTASTGTASDVVVGSTVTVAPGARVANPDASLDPNASPGPGMGMSFGAATEVTVLEP